MHATVLEQLAVHYQQADFLTIYIVEAHAADEWSLRDSQNAEMDGRWDVKVAQTLQERQKLASDWVAFLAAKTQYVVDLMDDNARLAYGAWPERLVILEDGVVQYYGAQGPWGYQPDEVARWLQKRFPDATLPSKF